MLAQAQQSTASDLPAAWRARASELRRFADAEGAARAFECAAEELENSLRLADDETLSLREAARISGYSADHLGRLVRNGKIPNVGRTNAPRIRRRDIRRKAASLRVTASVAYDPVADARSLMGPTRR
jgi:hypothetical protein